MRQSEYLPCFEGIETCKTLLITKEKTVFWVSFEGYGSFGGQTYTELTPLL